MFNNITNFDVVKAYVIKNKQPLAIGAVVALVVRSLLS